MRKRKPLDLTGRVWFEDYGFLYVKPDPPPPRRRRGQPVEYPYTAADGRIFFGRGRFWAPGDTEPTLRYLTAREIHARDKWWNNAPAPTMIHGRARD